MHRIGGGGSRKGFRPLVLLGVLALVVLLAGGVALWRTGRTGSGSVASGGIAPTSAPSNPTPSPSPRPDSRAPVPNPDRLAAALKGPLADPGFSGPAQLEVSDLDTDHVLYQRDADTPEAPASTAKLLTALAVLHRFGPNHRLDTKAYLSGHTLYVVGAGDPTLSPVDTAAVSLTHGSVDHPASLAALARQVRKAGVTRLDRVVGDASLFSGAPVAQGWPTYFVGSQVAPLSALGLAERRTPDPAASATDAMRGALVAAGVQVPAGGSGRLPKGARLVGTVSSPPLSALVEHMLSWSDNDMAEALGRVLASSEGRQGSFAGAAAAVIDGARQLGLTVDDVQMHDASGLSKDDRVPPSLLVDVLELASDPAHPEFQPILAGLPVAGHSGTLLLRYHDATTQAGAGVVHAKSGRLLGMNALAGLVKTRQGRMLVFSLRAPTASLDAGEHAMDRVAATLASCGCR